MGPLGGPMGDRYLKQRSCCVCTVSVIASVSVIYRGSTRAWFGKTLVLLTVSVRLPSILVNSRHFSSFLVISRQSLFLCCFSTKSFRHFSSFLVISRHFSSFLVISRQFDGLFQSSQKLATQALRKPGSSGSPIIGPYRAPIGPCRAL